MPSSTDNHGYQLFSDGEDSWEHRSDFNALEVDIEVRDTETNIGNYTPHNGAKFLATDTGNIYIGDGSSWGSPVLTIGSGGSGDYTSVEGIGNTRQHIGPPHQGDYHEDDDEMWGVHFDADPDLQIQSAVVDFDADNSTVGDVDISLYEAETTNAGENSQEQSVVPSGMTESEALVDSVSTTLTDGPQRITLGFTTPSSPVTGEFFLGADPSDAGETIYMRRLAGWSGWDDYSFDNIDLRFGSRWNNTTNGDYTANYYRVFDIEIGDETTRVTSPWSHDVEEIYMRPRDPTEEFDDVSPRALWIDTS